MSFLRFVFALTDGATASKIVLPVGVSDAAQVSEFDSSANTMPPFKARLRPNPTVLYNVFIICA
jgi:hypothetical protein